MLHVEYKKTFHRLILWFVAESHLFNIFDGEEMIAAVGAAWIAGTDQNSTVKVEFWTKKEIADWDKNGNDGYTHFQEFKILDVVENRRRASELGIFCLEIWGG
jgi:hypothetical protein